MKSSPHSYTIILLPQQVAYPAAYPAGSYPATAAHDQGELSQLQQQLPAPGAGLDVEAQKSQQQQFIEDDADCICCGVPCTIL